MQRNSSHLKIIGSLSKAVCDIPIQICNSVRKQFSKCNLGEQWPFFYDNINNRILLIHDRLPDFENHKLLFLTKGPCIMDSPNSKLIPFISHKISEDTSQGKVYISIVTIKDAKIMIVIKVDLIHSKFSNDWILNSHEKYIKGTTGLLVVIDNSYMDSISSILLSHLVENHKSPHFPLCYGTYINGARFKRNTMNMNNNGNSSQVIWMEHLPHSMVYILSRQVNVEKWWSAFFQVFAGLAVARNQYNFIHNDLHCKNIRVRKVAEDSFIYYKIEDGTLLKVPTFGFVYVLIDFGRCLISPWKIKGESKKEKESKLISHDFSQGGSCGHMIPDNPTIDIVRLIGSIEDIARDTIENEEDLDQLKEFFNLCCQTEDEKFNLLNEWNKKSNYSNLEYYLDELPRKVCKDMQVFDLIYLFYEFYQIDKIPENIEPFFIPNSE